MLRNMSGTLYEANKAVYKLLCDGFILNREDLSLIHIYFMFEVIDNTVLDENYLMMWFRRPEFDRICWFHSDGSVRGGITWEDICRLEFPVPSIEQQRERCV